MTPVVCLIPRDRDNQICALTCSFLAQVIEAASDLEVLIYALPSEFADPAEVTIDEAYRQAQETERGRSLLDEAVSVMVQANPTGEIGVLLAGVGHDTRFHQYRDLLSPRDPLSDVATLVFGAFRAHVIPASHANEVKFLTARPRTETSDFALRIATSFAKSGWKDGARSWWASAEQLTDRPLFEAAYYIAVSLKEEGDVVAATRHLDRAQQAARDERQRACVDFQRGWLALDRRRPDDARAHFDACLERCPASGMARLGLAYALAAGGDRVAALAAVRRCLVLKHDETPELGDASWAAEALLGELGV
jgi:tetratricopeptide (TPR) repeat protein